MVPNQHQNSVSINGQDFEIVDEGPGIIPCGRLSPNKGCNATEVSRRRSK